LKVCTFHNGIPTPFQTCYLTANQNVRLVAFVSQFAHGIPMCPLQCSSRYSKPLSESIFWRGESLSQSSLRLPIIQVASIIAPSFLSHTLSLTQFFSHGESGAGILSEWRYRG